MENQRKGNKANLLHMHNVGIVVKSLDETIPFFTAIGLTLEGRFKIDEEWAGRVTGVRDQQVEVAMMVTPDGHSRLELSQFHEPAIASNHTNAPVNSLGYLRVMFAVDNLDELLTRLYAMGATLVNEVVQYQDVYRLCYVRSPEGILVGLAEPLGG